MPASRAGKKPDWIAAAIILTLLLIVAFSPVVSGQRHLMVSAWDAPSIMNSGAYDPIPRPEGTRVARSSDPGAGAWTIEPWFKLISKQYWGEFNFPLWNPYNAFGTPLLGSAQPQPFFPLTVLLSVHVTTFTYSLFILARLLVGGLLGYLFARQFMAFLPSLVAAITFMLSGYFINYLNMPHVSAEVLTPGLLLAFEILARRNSWAAAAGVSATILLISTGGMPESMFLIVSFGCLYFLARVFFSTNLRAGVGSLLTKFAVSILLGFGLSAIVLLPFAEFARIAFDAHQAANLGGGRVGLGHDDNFSLAIQYLLPLIFGPPLASVFQNLAGWTGLRGYWGIVPFFFATAAVLFAFSRPRSANKGELFLISFFSITLVLMLFKRFGSPLVNWIGALPLSEMVVYQKYQEPLIAICVAILAGSGFSILLEGRASSRLFLLAATVVLAVMLALGGSYLPLVLSPDLKWAKLFYLLSIAFGVTLLTGIISSILLFYRSSPTRHLWLAYGFVGLLSLELLCTFILPCFYLMGSFAPARADPYAGAPYIGLIRGLNSDQSRIFAREDLLYPNWSSAFELPDARSLDAIYYDRYRRFMQSFLLRPDDGRRQGDLQDRFTGSEFTYAFDTEVERRFLAISSIKYLIGRSEFSQSTKSVVGDQNRRALSETDFKKIYSGEALVYEVSNVLPRAALFSSFGTLPDDAVLLRLKSPGFNLRQTALVSRELISGSSAPSALAGTSPIPASAGLITAYQSQYVAIEAETPTPALLVLNDANYPGWHASVNGASVDILTTNFLFRGVLVPPGKSTVEFRYQPRSFRIGAAISIAAFMILAMLLAGHARRPN